MAHHGFRGLRATRLALGLFLLAAATLAQSPASAATMVTLGSAEGRAGQTVTVPITLAAGATASGLDITVAVTASPGAPAVGSPVFALGAQASDWSIFSTGNPWRYVAYKIPGIDGPAELLRLSVTLDPSTPVGATYTLSASSVDLTHKDGLPEYTDTAIVQPGQIAVSNHPPAATPASVSTAEDTAKAITLAGTDPDGDPLTYSLASQPAHGTLNGTAPSLTYTPAPNYNGPDGFTFTVSDGVATSAPATVSITVTPVNDPPVATPQSVTTAEDTPKALTLSGTDVDGDPLSYAVTSQPAHGTLSGTAPNLTYTPSANYNGPDSFSFSASDGSATSSPATVSLTITPVNDPPVLTVPGTRSANEGQALSFVVSATDVDGDAVTLSATGLPSGAAFAASTGSFNWTPSPGQAGTYTVTFGASDGHGGTDSETVRIDVAHVNRAPSAAPAAVSTAEDTAKPITLTGSDPDGDTLTYTVSTPPAHGTLSGAAPNLTYTPSANYNGSDSFLFTVSDGALTSAPASVSITITAVNDPPVLAVPAAQTVAEGQPLSFTVGATDVDGDMVTLSATGLPSGASFTPSSGAFSWTPGYVQSGGYTVTFSASDGHGGSDSKSVSISVTDVNRAPTATPQSLSTAEDTAKAITLSGTDPDGDTLSYSVVGQPAHGTLSGTAPNLTYMPAANYNGSDSFSFTVSDGKATSTAATIGLAITAVNDPPVLTVPVAQSVNEGQPLTFSVSATDPDGDSVALSASGLPSGATFTPATGTFAWTPGYTQSGTYTVTFTANDGHGGTDTKSVRVDVSDVNRAPSAAPLTVPATEDTPKTLTLQGSDPDGDALTYSVLTQPARGTLSGTAPSLTYTPAANYNGPDSFTYSVSDGKLTSAPATVSLTVAAVNDPPTATAQSVTTAEDTAKPITLSGTDPDGDTLTYAIVAPPAHGTLTGTAPNLTYTPAANYNGPDSFSFSVRDPAQATSQAAVSITVTPVNDPPVLTVPGTQTGSEGQTLSFTVSATDVDGDALTLSASGLPTGATFTAATGVFSWTPSFSQAGSYTLTFSVSDGKGGTDSKSVRVDVTSVN
ncbi:MAG TPA: Ig-like domain-containing protein, partial [Armatimonadota bacterium]